MIPDLLTEDRNKQKPLRSKKLLTMFGLRGSKRSCDVITGEETQLYFQAIPKQAS